MRCRHLLGHVNGFCVQCDDFVRVPQIKYSHSLRRLLWDESTIPVLAHGVAIVRGADLEALVVLQGEDVRAEMRLVEVVL